MVVHPSLPHGYVSAFGADTLEVYDLETLSLITSVPVGHLPRRPAVSLDGRFIVVPNLLSQSFSVVRTSDYTVAATILSANYPSEVVFSPTDASLAYAVTAGSSYLFTVINVDALSVVAQVALPMTDLNQGVAISPDGQLAVVGNPASGAPDKVTLIDLSSYSILGQVSVGDSPRDLVFSPDSSTLWVANQGSSTVSKVDVATRVETAVFPVALGPRRLSYVPSTGVLVVNCPSGSVTQVLDSISGVVLAQAPSPGTDSGAAGTDLLVLPAGGLALVTAPFLDALFVIDVDPASATFGSILQTIPAQGFPTDLALSADGGTAYMVSYVGAAVTVLDVPDPVTQIDIDIKPGSDPNSINPRSRGVIPVAILTGDTFDATTVDPSTVRFGAAGTEAAPAHSALEDVDGDGDVDFVLHFRTQDTGIACEDTSATLTGSTMTGEQIQGADSIRTVGCP
jgi:YVTN family beta-propeller protein